MSHRNCDRCGTIDSFRVLPDNSQECDLCGYVNPIIRLTNRIPHSMHPTLYPLDGGYGATGYWMRALPHAE